MTHWRLNMLFIISNHLYLKSIIVYIIFIRQMQQDIEEDLKNKSTQLSNPIDNQNQKHQEELSLEVVTVHKIKIYISDAVQNVKGRKYVIPLVAYVLLRVQAVFQEKQVKLFIQQDFQKEFYYVEMTLQQTDDEVKILSNLQLFQNLEYSKFQQKQYNETIYNDLPEYVLLKYKFNHSQLISLYQQQEFDFAHWKGTYLFEQSKRNELQLKNFMQKYVSKESDPQYQKKRISKYLLIELKEDETDLLRLFSFIQSQMEKCKIYHSNYNNSKFFYLMEFKHIFDLFAMMAKLQEQDITYKLGKAEDFQKVKKIFTHLAEYKEEEKLELPVINRMVKERDFTYFQKLFNNEKDNFLHSVGFMMDNWQLYQPFNEKHLEDFQNYLAYYTQSEIYQTLLHKAKKLIPRCNSVNEYIGVRQNFNYEETMANNLFMHYVKDVKARLTGEGRYLIEQNDSNKKLSQRIAEHQEFISPSNRGSRWQSVFGRIGNFHQISQTETVDEGDNNVKNQGRMEFMENIQLERLLDLQCLGCCPFFYHGINICTSALKHPRPILIQSIQKFEDSKQQLTLSMQNLMNNYGGIILFDCVPSNLQIIPGGCSLSETEREQITENIKNLFQGLQLQDMDQHIQKEMTISFVPLIKNPYKHKLKPDSNIRSYIDKYFVTRIKVERYYSQVENSLEIRQSMFLGPKISCFNHSKCQEPDKLPQRKREIDKPTTLKVEYKFLTFINASKDERAQIGDFLKQKGIRMQIKSKFEQKPFKCCQKSGAIYHDIMFQDLKKILKQGGLFKKEIPLVEVTQFIALPKRTPYNNMSQTDYQCIMSEFHKEFQSDEIFLWRYNQGERTEFYFELNAEGKEQLIFLNLILTHYQEKGRFKMPRGYEQFSHSTVAQKFHIVFPSKESKAKQWGNLPNKESKTKAWESQMKNRLNDKFLRIKNENIRLRSQAPP